MLKTALRSYFACAMALALTAFTGSAFWSAADERNPPAAEPARAAAPFAGSFTGGKVTVELSERDGVYSGTIKIGGESFPATARPAADGLEGSFKAGDDAFTFTARFDGDTLKLTSGGETHALKRAAAAAAVNPPAVQPVGGGGRTKVLLKVAAEPGTCLEAERLEEHAVANQTTYYGTTKNDAFEAHVRRKSMVEVVAVKDGMPTALRIRSADDCSAELVRPGQEPQRLPYAYAGRTVHVARGADGTITDDDAGEASDSDMRELHGALLAASPFPREAVAVGEEWSPDPAFSAAAFAASGPRDRAVVKLKLSSLKDVAGRATAVIDISADVTATDKGQTSHSAMKGTWLADVKTGLFIGMDLHVNRSSSGDTPLTALADGKAQFSHTQTGDAIHITAKGTIQPAGVGVADPLAARPGGTLTLKPAKAFDTMLGCDAYTILVPEGWTLHAEPLWNPWRTPQQMLYERMIAPDGGAMFHYAVWQYHSEVGAKAGSTDERAMIVQPFVDKPEDYLTNILLPEQRKGWVGAKVVSIQDVTEALAKGATLPPGAGTRCSRIRLAHERGGVAYEEDFFCTLSWLGPPSRRPGEVQVWQCVCQSYLAPKGRLEKMMPMFTAIDQSRAFDAHWFTVATARQQAWQQNYRQFQQDQLAEVMKRITLQANATRELSEAQRAAWRQDQAAKARSSESFRQYIGGVDSYRSPFGGASVLLPSGYSHAFESNDGRVIWTNDHAYEPPKDPAAEWRPMELGQ